MQQVIDAIFASKSCTFSLQPIICRDCNQKLQKLKLAVIATINCTIVALWLQRFAVYPQDILKVWHPKKLGFKACSYLILAYMGWYMWAEWAETFVEIFRSKVQSFKSAKGSLFLQSFTDYLSISIRNYQNCLKRSFYFDIESKFSCKK